MSDIIQLDLRISEIIHLNHTIADIIQLDRTISGPSNVRYHSATDIKQDLLLTDIINHGLPMSDIIQKKKANALTDLFQQNWPISDIF